MHYYRKGLWVVEFNKFVEAIWVEVYLREVNKGGIWPLDRFEEHGSVAQELGQWCLWVAGRVLTGRSRAGSLPKIQGSYTAK